MDGSRIRAYSVGSQASAQRKMSNLIDKEMGNLMKIDPRTGAKSSSAPLLNNRPPRIRSSTSRSEVGEDLMEIDYNKTKYSSSIDSDSYTIEPVGRARSGSYSSSSNNALKLLHNRDKIKSQSAGHSSNSVNEDADCVTDYLTMSPLSEQGKSRNFGSTSKSDSISKRMETLHPPGDYVSLDPSCTYTSGDRYFVGSNNSTDRANIFSVGHDSRNHSLSMSMLSKINDCDSAAKFLISNKDSIIGGHETTNPQKLEKQSSSDYMCMNYEQKSENKNPGLKVLTSPNGHSLHSVSSLEKEGDLSSMKASTQQGKDSKPVSPVTKTAPFTPAANFVPKTPPPSPSYGPLTTTFSGLPFVDNVVRRLSQPNNTAAVQPAPNCGEIRLNYASLDLPPASDDDGKGTSAKLRKTVEDEVQDSALTYAQIDFSPVRQKAFQESESLSHL